MSDHQFGRLQPRALAEGDDNDDRLLLDGESKSTSPATPNQPCKQHQHPWPTLQPCMPRDDFSHDSGQPLTYERAAGVDAIAHRLSIQHLRLDYQPPPSASQAAMAPRSSAVPCLPLAVAPTYLAPLPVAESRQMVVSSTQPAVSPSEPLREDKRDPSRHQASIPREDDRPRRINSSKFHSTIQNTRAMQTLVESRVCTRARCDMLDLPLEAATDVSTHDCTEMEVDPTSIQDDDDLGDDTDIEKSLIEQLTEARHGNGTLGMRKVGFPLYRSSTETALRCQNLVRNKPRMRKRKKLRDQPRQSAISAAAGSSVASKSSTS